MIQLSSRNTLLRAVCNPKLPCNGKCRVGMVSCDHHRGYPRPRKALYSSHRLRPDRILHADKPEKHHPPLAHAPFRRYCQRQHASSLSHQPLLYTDQPVTLFQRKLCRSFPPADAAAIFQNPFCRSLCISRRSPFFPVQGRHHFPFRIKTFLVQPWIPFPEPLNPDIAVRRHIEEGKLRGITDFFLPDLAVVTKYTSLQKAGCAGIRLSS